MARHSPNFKSIKVRSELLWLLFILFFVSSPVAGQEEGIYNIQSDSLLADQSPPSISIFEDRSTLEIDIETNLDKLFNNMDDPDNQKATLTIFLNDSVKIVKKIKIRVRGNTRIRICDVPPMRLDLNQTEFLEDWFGSITSLKLVNTCKNGPEYKDYLHKEYIMYELYRSLTDVSYRVRLINLRIRDSKKVKENITAYAFFIENDKSVAARTQLEEIEMKDTNIGELMTNFYLQPDEQTLYNISVLSIYQYMLGNSDWYISGLHNLKIFKNPVGQYAIPYDFDYAGFVDAKYAIPSSSVPIKNVRERYYQGPCCDPAIFEQALDHVLSKKDYIYQTINFYPYLKKREKEDLTKYIDEFFEETATKDAFIQENSRVRCQD